MGVGVGVRGSEDLKKTTFDRVKTQRVAPHITSRGGAEEQARAKEEEGKKEGGGKKEEMGEKEKPRTRPVTPKPRKPVKMTKPDDSPSMYRYISVTKKEQVKCNN